MREHSKILKTFWSRSLHRYLGTALGPDAPERSDGVYPVLSRLTDRIIFKAGESKRLTIEFAMLVDRIDGEVIDIILYDFPFSNWRIIHYENRTKVTISNNILLYFLFPSGAYLLTPLESRSIVVLYIQEKLR